MSTLSDKGEFWIISFVAQRQNTSVLQQQATSTPSHQALLKSESKPVKKSVDTNKSASEVDVEQNQTPQRKRSVESDESNHGAVTLYTPQIIVGKRQKKEITADTELDGIKQRMKMSDI
ncbi:hypothetical protein MIR68_007404 [Amoeboaphelidium protococcarum]|nr:hypothetical protein MIR68_007404 [Amoeboaphelidium protococcarum]